MTTRAMPCIAATLALLILVTGMQASAVEIQTGAAGACKSALPAFDGNIRTRPLAVQNEGGSGAFVSCSNGNNVSDPGLDNTIVGIWLQNDNATQVVVSCTFVNGRLGASPTFHPKTQAYAPGLGTFMIWEAETGEPFSQFANFSCNLPPGVGISRIAFAYPGPTR